MYMQALSFLMPYSFQLASVLPRKTVAERGPAAHSLHAKKKSARKRCGPSAAAPSPPPIPSVQPKRAHVEEAGDEAGDSVPQPTHSSKAPVRSVSLALTSVLETLLTLCILLRRPPQKIQYICSMRRLILLLMAFQERMAIGTTSVTWVVAKH